MFWIIFVYRMVMLIVSLVLLGIVAILVYTYFLYASLKKEHKELMKALSVGKISLYQERINRYNCRVDMYNSILWRLSVVRMDRLFKPLPYILPEEGNQSDINKI